jgi:hypothetical protein
MFDTSWIADLDAGGVCEAMLAARDVVREQEWRELVLAAQWAVLHDPSHDPAVSAAGASAGGERVRRVGGDGTPEIAEFGCAELGLVMGTGFIAAGNLIRDAVDLQHRHPHTCGRCSAPVAGGCGRPARSRT